MKKLTFSLILISFIIFSGCSNQKEKSKENNELQNIQIINIYKIDDNSNYQEKIYGVPIVTLTSNEDINKIKSAISNSKTIEGIFDITVADYIVEVIESKNSKEYYLLWLKEENETSSMMNQKNPHIILSLTIKDTTILKEIIFK